MKSLIIRHWEYLLALTSIFAATLFFAYWNDPANIQATIIFVLIGLLVAFTGFCGGQTNAKPTRVTDERNWTEILYQASKFNICSSDEQGSIRQLLKTLTTFLDANIAIFNPHKFLNGTVHKQSELYINPDRRISIQAKTLQMFDTLLEKNENMPKHTISRPCSTILCEPFQEAGQHPIHTIVPVFINSELVATIELITPHKIKQEELSFLDMVSNIVSAALERAYSRNLLQKAVSRLENSQNVAKIGSWEWNLQTNENYWSAQIFQLFGYPLDSVLPSTEALIEFAHFSERRRLYSFLSNIRENLGTNFQFNAVKLNGEKISVCIRAEETENQDIIMGVIQDITERNLLDNMKADFISTISHELRTPLTAIKGSLSLIECGTSGSTIAENQHLLDIATKNVTRLLFLVNDILDLEKANSGQIQLSLQDTIIQNVVSDTTKQMQHYATQFNSTIVVELPTKEIVCNIDPDRVAQALTNLLSNALKYSPEHSLVTVKLDATPSKVRILVIDEGCGIPEDMHYQVFDKFSQIKSNDQKKVGGSGLGLSIAKALIEKHGGALDFYSNKGRGTTFFIELNTISEVIQIHPDNNNDHIASALIIEDDPATCRYLFALLSAIGIAVSTVNSIEQAKRVLNEADFDFITLDVMLPDQNGLEFIRENSSNGKINSPVIIISAVADIVRENMENKNLGIYRWFTKPINQSEFIDAIESLIHEPEARKANSKTH